MIIFHILFALFLVLGIYNSAVANSILAEGRVDLSDVSFSVFWYIFVVFLYVRSVNIVIKRDFELYGKPVSVIVTVTENEIRQLQSTGSGFQLNYCDIKRVVQTKKFIYLWSKTNLIYSFKRDSFSLGNADDFLLFLKSKGLKVRKE